MAATSNLAMPNIGSWPRLTGDRKWTKETVEKKCNLREKWQSFKTTQQISGMDIKSVDFHVDGGGKIAVQYQRRPFQT